MADAELPQQQTEKAREFAKESADGFLMQQIQAVHLCMEFQKAVARVEFFAEPLYRCEVHEGSSRLD